MSHPSGAAWQQGPKGPPSGPPFDPTQMGLDGMDQSHSTLARGSAAIQDVVFQLEHHPLVVISAFEKQVARDCGALQPWQPWSTSALADKTIEKLQGHVTLKKMLRVLSHIYELHRRYPQNPEYSRAFTAQAMKVTLDASRAGGSWELSWPLLGLVDPEEHDQHALTPTERVAIAALAKERKIVSEIATAAKARRNNAGKKDGAE